MGNEKQKREEIRKTGEAASSRKTPNQGIPQVKNFTYSCMASAQEAKKPIYDVKFHLNLQLGDDKGDPKVFATAGSDRINIFKCDPDGALRILQVYSDPQDCFYSCAWTSTSKNAPLLVAGGSKGILRLLEPNIVGAKGFVGHPNSINDIITHPREPALVFTASKDHSIRLWNVHTIVLVAIFGGVDGHRDEVISLDVNSDCTRLVSGGMDHAMKMWNIQNAQLRDVIQKSHTYIRQKRSFQTLKQHFPEFSTRSIHGDYVDCVRWFGDLVISKSCRNRICIWKGGWPLQKWEDLKPTDYHSSIIATLTVEDCALWYVRFCLDSQNNLLALGNQKGQIYIFDLLGSHPHERQTPGIILRQPQCTSVIRQTAFSRDGTVLIGVCDDGTVWRWNATGKKRNAEKY